jgi:hypothetical protein
MPCTPPAKSIWNRFRLALDLRLSCARNRASLESSLDDKNECSLMID